MDPWNGDFRQQGLCMEMAVGDMTPAARMIIQMGGALTIIPMGAARMMILPMMVDVRMRIQTPTVDVATAETVIRTMAVMGGPGGSDSEKGNPLSGKNCRLGQIIAVKLHDGGTPGTNGDGITWKWFNPESPGTPAIDNCDEWPHLCKKTILAGNLVIHK